MAESLNYFVSKARDRSLPDRIAQNLVGEDGTPWIKVLHVDKGIWAAAREKFRALSRAGLSFTDCTCIVVMEQLDLDAIISFDSGFDGILVRHG